MSTFRISFLEKIVNHFKQDPRVVAVFEGGSAANDRLDEFSDMDLNVVCSKDQAEVFASAEVFLEREFSISHKVVEGTGIWEGLEMRMYFFDRSPEHFFLDLGVIEERFGDTMDEFMNVERHGRWVPHFDPKGLSKELPMSSTELGFKHKESYRGIREKYPVYLSIAKKALKRGQYIECYACFHAALVRPLVTLWGIQHRPARFDFSLRYTHIDFPKDIHDHLSDFVFVKDPQDLADKLEKIEGLYEQEFSKLDQDYLN